MNKIILASKSKVRKEILDKNNIYTSVEHLMWMRKLLKNSLLKKKHRQKLFKNLAELKEIK